MKILIFTEGTILMHLNGKNLSRKERVKQSKIEGIQGEKRKLTFKTSLKLPKPEYGSVYDFERYIPIGNAVEKINFWSSNGAGIYYLTSRRIKVEIEAIENILRQYGLPNYSNLLYRKTDEEYKDIAERIKPDILIEDDCESIGRKSQMTYTNINKDLKKKIKSIVVKEFEGIEMLPENISVLTK